MLLAVCMLAISVSSIFGVFSFAAGDDSAVEEKKTYEKATQDALNPAVPYLDFNDKIAQEMAKGYTKLLATSGNYELYCNIYTGEVYYKDTLSGQYLTTNPYSLNTVSKAAKSQYLSQIYIQYMDITGQKVTWDSFTEAAQRGQIVVKQIRNGIRVEYTIGRTNANYLVPGRIREDRFASLVLQPIEEYIFDIVATENDMTVEQVATEFEDYVKQNSEMTNRSELMRNFATQVYHLGSNKAYQVAYYRYNNMIESYGFNMPPSGGQALENFLKEYPCCAEQKEDGSYYSIYVLDETNQNAIDAIKTRLETTIKTYSSATYTYEELQYDNNKDVTGYEERASLLPVFRMSLEYTIGSDGTLSVRLPANGIRYDSSNFTLLSVSTLKTFGAANVDLNEGYIFYPDGSGALIDFDYLRGQTSVLLPNRVYGEDFAYYNVAEKHQESVRVPVFGIVDTDPETKTSQGFIAYLTEGESLATLTAEWNSNKYAMVYPTYTPRPSDSYTLNKDGADATEWLVVSDKKYTGSFMMEARMLSGENASWVGMANIYREKLWGDSTGIVPADENNLPLYIESFGSFEATDKILSIPVTVDKPLTTFDDIETMYKELSEKGVKNINFKLTGFANGGMYSTYPTKIDWMGAVGGVDGLNELLAYADSLTDGYLKVYPEFEFSYNSVQELFDGTNLKDDAARTVDNRYANKQIYDCLYQEFTSYFDIVIAPDAIARHYAKFSESFDRYEGLDGLSAGSLGSNLNSTFYEDAPYNREDAKGIVTGVLADMKKDVGSLMLSGANAYALAYAEHFLDVPLDSSQYKYNSRTVPFLGMLLHGYVNFAGSAINEAGDSNYHLLRSIENGAALYYVLSYQNTSLLKEDILLSNYYAINYEIWKDDLVKQYTKLNETIGDLQTYIITNEETLIAERLPDLIELNRYRNELTDLAASGVEAAIKALINTKKDDFRFESYINNLFVNGIQDPVKAIFEADKAALQVTYDAFGYVKGETDPEKAYVDGTNGLYMTMANKLNAKKAAQTAFEEAEAAQNPNLEAYRKELDKRTAEFNAAYAELDAARIKAEDALSVYDGHADLNIADGFNKDMFIVSLEKYVSAGWGTVTASQKAILVAFFESYLANGETGYVSSLGILIRANVDRDAVVSSILDVLYADVIRSFGVLFKNEATNAKLVSDFKEAVTEAIDEQIAAYYADFLIAYFNEAANVDRFGKLTKNEIATLKAMLAKFYVAGTKLSGAELQTAVELAAREYLNVANNDTRELTETQKAIIADAIAFMQEESFFDAPAYVIELDAVSFAFENVFTDSDSEAEDYAFTDYTIADDSVVVVTYEKRDGSDTVEILLNFNVFSVKVNYNGKTYILSPYGYERISD